MPEERGLYPKQRVREQLVYFARLHQLSASAASRRADELLELFGLTARAGDDLEKLSLGNQQRLQIAVALVHEPVALILDEPFSGLDPEAVDAMAGLMRTCSDDGIPILFSSHQLDLVERLCDDIVVIARGRVVAAGTATELRAAHDPVLRLDAPGVGDWAGAHQGIDVRRRDRDSVQFVEVAGGAAQQLLHCALDAGPVSHFGEVVMPLSEIYKEVVR
jgi:ABC-2 type transport system ATP-binding protein